MNNFYNLYPKRIAIFRALQLGDLLCAIPAVRALKKKFPESEITLIGLPWAAGFVKIFSAYFSDFIVFPGYPGLVEQPFDVKKFITFLQIVHERKFDLLLQMHGNGSVINPLMGMLGAHTVAGFCESGRYIPDENHFIDYPEGLPEPERHLRLIRSLGIEDAGIHLEFPLTEDDREKFEIIKRDNDLVEGAYICLHAGARDTKRWWGEENFITVANWFGDKGFKVVLTGTESEMELVNRVASGINYPFVNMAGKTNLSMLGCLVEQARLLFSNDTGVSHLAAALKVPSVIVFLTSDPVRWAPLDTITHQIVHSSHADDIPYILKKIETVLQFNQVKYNAFV